jgi:hypothetical protein
MTRNVVNSVTVLNTDLVKHDLMLASRISKIQYIDQLKHCTWILPNCVLCLTSRHGSQIHTTKKKVFILLFSTSIAVV